jgi:hypothetical protein
MRNLKEQMERDCFVFLNPKEFGEEMLINGIPCLGCFDEEQEQSVKQFFGAGTDNVFGVFTSERVLFFMRLDGTTLKTPVPGQELDIDGKTWTVRDATSESGIIKAVLYRNDS